MGAVLQTAGAAEIVAELTCCAASSVCGLITRDNATRAKFRYCSFLLLATVTCVILLIPGLRNKLDRIPNFCNKLVTPETCDKLVGFSAVYRILISVTLFHLLLSLLTIRVTRVKGFRARFNNGLWLFKMGLLFGLTIASFYIPRKTGFFRLWMYISLTGGFMFVMFQIILIIDFGHSWSISWAEKLESGYTKLWYLAMAVVTLLMFSVSVGAILSFYIFFTHPPKIMKCHANVFYITFIGIQCFLATVVSVTPTVQQELPGTGLLQSSVVVLYTMYLTWNTLSSEPDSTCNPLGNIILEYDSLTGVSGEAIFGCLLTLILLFFACTVRASTSHLGKYGLALAESEAFAMTTYKEDERKETAEKQLESGKKEVLLDEYVGYNYSFFHIIMCLASLHILMVLTNWHSPDETSNMKKLVKNWASVWVQMASSFVCVLVYVWFLVTPLVKKMWGPMFGIFMDEENDSLSPHIWKSQDEREPTLTTKEVYTNQRTMKEQKRLTKTTNHDADYENKHGRSESRNTYDPYKVKKSKSLQRKASEESIISAVSAVSNSASVARKRKHKLLTVQQTENYDNNEEEWERTNQKSSISDKNRVQLDDHKRNSRLKRRMDQDVMYSSCESIVSRASSLISKKKKKNTKKKTSEMSEEKWNDEKNTESAVVNVSEVKKSPVNENANFESAFSFHQKKKNERRKKNTANAPIEKEIVEEEIIIPTDIEDDRVIGIKLDESSLVPSVFNRKTQNPDTAKEILQLQWKILRTQAKVVKIQERIIRLQSETESTEPGNCPPSYTLPHRKNIKKTHKKEIG